MSVAISVPTSTALERGGLLFHLPRELRDEIYRYLLKGIYFLGEPRELTMHGMPHGISYPTASPVKPCFNILHVSKPIRDEAMAVLYSESRFRINYDLRQDEASRLSSLEALKHAMNVELNVPVPDLSLEFDYIMEQSWKATMECIRLGNMACKTLYIRWRLRIDDVEKAIPEWMFRELESFTQTQKVVVAIEPMSPDQRQLSSGTRRIRRPHGMMIICGSSFYHERKTTDDIDKLVDSKMEEIMDHLVPALGAAAVGSTHHRAHPRYAKLLVFHPRKHMAGVLRGRAKVLRSEADALDLEADKADATL